MSTTTAEADKMAMEIANTREQRRNELATVKFDAQGGSLFIPTDGRMLMDMANMMSQSGVMVRDFYRGNPGACMALIAVCAPYGLNPVMVSWHTYKASRAEDAPVSYEAKVIVAMLDKSGILKGSLDYEYFGEGQGRYCIANGTLKDGSVKTVQTPPLSQINPKNSPLWKSDPDQQLAYYAGRAWVRRHKPAMMLGIVSDDEELPRVGPDNAKDVTPRRAGGAVYRDLDPAPPAAPAEQAAVEDFTDAEVVDTAAATPTSRLASLFTAAQAETSAGRDAFIRWWGRQPAADREAMSGDQVGMDKLASLCADADERIARERETAADPFASAGAPDETPHDEDGIVTDAAPPADNVVNGRVLNFDLISGGIRKALAEGAPADQVRDLYSDELAAMKKARPDLYAAADRDLKGAA